MQAQIDGNVVRATFTLSLPKKVSPPPKLVASASKRDASRTDNASVDIEKDGPKRPRECMLLTVDLCYVLFTLIWCFFISNLFLTY